MAKITGTTGNDNLTNGTTGNDQFYTGDGNDYVQGTAGNDSYNLGFASSTSYWRYGFSDFDTLDYRYTWSSYGLANETSLRIIVDLELGTIKKLNASSGATLGTDTVSGADGVYGTQGNDSFKGRDFWASESFRGFGGNDTIDGRGNEDLSEYYNANTSGITVNMATGTVSSSDVLSGNDTLREIEGIGGTNFADTYTATGYSGSSTNRNSFGQDWNVFVPQSGDDIITGNGQTILSYGGVGGNMTVALAGQTAVGVKSHIITSFVDDASNASYNPGNINASGVNFIIGGNYDDTLSGGGKVNSIGFSAPYTVSGDVGFEMFRGQGGDDFIDGKDGYDRADYRQGGAMTEGIHVLLAAGTVTGDALQVGTDTLRGIESIRGTYLDDVYDARGFTLKNATTKSVNNGDSIVYVPAGETLASTAHNDFVAAAGNDTVIGNGATRVSFDGIFVANLIGTSVIANFTSASAGTADYGLTDGGYGKVTFSGTYSVRGGPGNDAITGTVGFQNLQGSYGNDTIKGGDGADLIFGFNGGDTLAINKTTLYTDNDSLDGGAGNDLMRGDFGNDTLLGGSGNDSLDGGTGNDSLVGGTGNDLYTVDSLSDVISETTTTVAEIDSVSSSIAWTLGSYLENLTLTGSGAISGTGNTLGNVITGNTGNNSLNGSSGNDTLSGAEGNDSLNGGSGNDSLIGGAGNDLYTVDSPTDKISETSTIATEIDSVSSSVHWTLGANLEKLTLTGSTAINGTGNGMANTIAGNTGNNLLDGGSGKDILSGGAGLDIFRFSSALNASTNVDTINGFVVLDDAIQLENSIFVKLTTPEVLSTLFFKSNTTGTAADSDDYIVYESDTGKLFYDADGNGPGASVLFATLIGAPVLTSADVFVT